jgi:hypothetical protein
MGDRQESVSVTTEVDGKKKEEEPTEQEPAKPSSEPSPVSEPAVAADADTKSESRRKYSRWVIC